MSPRIPARIQQRHRDTAAWRAARGGRGVGGARRGYRPGSATSSVRMRRVYAACLVTGTGRGVRLLLGILLISTGLATLGGIGGAVLALAGLVTILEVLFDVLLIGPMLGSPVDGRAIRKGQRRLG